MNINAAGRQRARQGVRAVGREGAALRDQEHHAAARRAGRDGKADARRAREARGDSDVRRRSATPPSTTPRARSSRSSRRRKRGASSRSTRPKARRRRFWRSRRATAEGIRQVAEAIRQPGGIEATQLRVAEQYIDQFGELAKKTHTMILPANVADIGVDGRDGDEGVPESVAGAKPEVGRQTLARSPTPARRGRAKAT